MTENVCSPIEIAPESLQEKSRRSSALAREGRLPGRGQQLGPLGPVGRASAAAAPTPAGAAGSGMLMSIVFGVPRGATDGSTFSPLPTNMVTKSAGRMFRCAAASRSSGRQLADRLLVALQEVGRVAVELVLGEPVQHRPLGGEREDQRVQNGVAGAADLLGADRLREHRFDLVVHVAGGRPGRVGLGHGVEEHRAGVVVARARARAGGVGQTVLGADLVEEAAGEAAADDLVEQRHRRVVGVVQPHPDLADDDAGVGRVRLVGEVEPGRVRPRDLRIGRQRRRRARPVAEHRAQGLLHLGPLEVAVDRQDHAVGVEVGLVERDQVVAGDGVDGGVLGGAGVRVLRPCIYTRTINVSSAVSVKITKFIVIEGW